MSLNSGYSLPWMQYPAFDFNALYNHYYNWILSIAFELLLFDKLPPTINPTFFKYCLYCLGKVVIFKDDNGNILGLNGARSNEPDIYYLPTNVIISNPRLKKSYDLRINEECVVVYCTETDKYNFNYYGGINTLIAKTATMLADNDISINVAQKNTRLINIISADDQNTKDSVDIVFKKMYAGDPYISVMSSLVGDLKAVPVTTTTNNSYIVQLVELHQYILSHFYEALGIQTHDNMKKERLITAEVEEDPALVRMNIENIYQTVNTCIQQVNEMFGTEIQVSINPLIISQYESSTSLNEEEHNTSLDQSDTETQKEQAPIETEDIEGKIESMPEQETEDVSKVSDITINVEDNATAEIQIIERGDDQDGVSEMDRHSESDNKQGESL